MPAILLGTGAVCSKSQRAFQDPFLKEYLQKNGLHLAALQDIKAGDILDLGNRKLEVIAMPGHTPGSLGLLDRTGRILFTGDAVNPCMWMQLPESSSIQDWVKMIDSLTPIRSEFD